MATGGVAAPLTPISAAAEGPEGRREDGQAGGPFAVRSPSASVSEARSHQPSFSTRTSLPASLPIPIPATSPIPSHPHSSTSRFADRLPLVPRIAGTNTLELLTGWLDLAFHRLGLKLNFATAFDLYSANCDDEGGDGDMLTGLGPASLEPPALPPPDEAQRLVTSYFASINVVFPALDPRPVVATFRASSWSVLGLCVSKAQTLGLDRRRSFFSPTTGGGHRQDGNGEDPAGDDEARRRLWWSIYAFEKLSAFEFGRPSTVRDAECDQPEPATDRDESGERPNFFRIVVSLARVLSEINGRSIHTRSQEERAVWQKVKTTGELVLLLMKWADGLPEGFRPRQELLSGCASHRQAAFIWMQYHNALLILLRNSFLISASATQTATERYAPGQPWAHVIRNGQAITLHAARSMVRLLVERAEHFSYSSASDSPINITPISGTVVEPLHALFVLGVHLLAHPGGRLARADLDLMRHAAEFAQVHADKFPQYAKPEAIVGRLLDVVGAAVETAQAQGTTEAERGRQRGTMDSSAGTEPPGSVGTARSADVAGEQGVFHEVLPVTWRRENGVVQNGLADGTGSGPEGVEDDGSAPPGLELGVEMEWFPALPDEIGWDWGDFGEMLRDGLGEHGEGVREVWHGAGGACCHYDHDHNRASVL